MLDIRTEAVVSMTQAVLAQGGSYGSPFRASRIADHVEDNAEFVTLFFQDGDLRNVLTRRLLDEVYDRIRKSPEEKATVLPLKRVPPEEVRPFVNVVPVYDLKVSAGRF